MWRKHQRLKISAIYVVLFIITLAFGLRLDRESLLNETTASSEDTEADTSYFDTNVDGEERTAAAVKDDTELSIDDTSEALAPKEKLTENDDDTSNDSDGNILNVDQRDEQEVAAHDADEEFSFQTETDNAFLAEDTRSFHSSTNNETDVVEDPVEGAASNNSNDNVNEHDVDLMDLDDIAPTDRDDAADSEENQQALLVRNDTPPLDESDEKVKEHELFDGGDPLTPADELADTITEEERGASVEDSTTNLHDDHPSEDIVKDSNDNAEAYQPGVDFVKRSDADVSKHYCGVWGSPDSKKPTNTSLLFKFFQYDILGNRTEFSFPDPRVEAAAITKSAIEKSQLADDDPVDEKPTNDFVDGLDELNKFFENVDAPDELDVGVGGSSIQEVLMRQGTQIVLKRIKLGVIFVNEIATKVKDTLLERMQDDEGNIAIFDKAKLDAAREWIVNVSVIAFDNAQRLMDRIMDGNFENIFDSFGDADDDDDNDLSLDFESAQRVSSARKEKRDPVADKEMEELLRMLGMSSESSKTTSGNGQKTYDPTSASLPTNEANDKTAEDKEMEDLLRQLGLQ